MPFMLSITFQMEDRGEPVCIRSLIHQDAARGGHPRVAVNLFAVPSHTDGEVGSNAPGFHESQENKRSPQAAPTTEPQPRRQVDHSFQDILREGPGQEWKPARQRVSADPPHQACRLSNGYDRYQ
jgi:hypothetical protein